MQFEKKGNGFCDFDIFLPDIKPIKLHSEADYYGLSHLIAANVGLPFIPRSFANWKHGWIFGELVSPIQLTTYGGAVKYLVATKSQESFLLSNGIEAVAVGMPFIYVEEEPVTRYKNSLLVMPPHSLPYTSHSWDEYGYAKEINSLKKDFDLIVVCLHSSCIEKGYWINAFEKYDIPWIIGADVFDKNAMKRMHRIFKSFEFMTTNAIGSHVLYAAYSGCKVSIYGKYFEFGKEDFKDDPFYRLFPDLLDHNLYFSSEKYTRKMYSDFFCYPSLALDKISWANEEIGKINKKADIEIAKLLGWTVFGQMKVLLNKVRRKSLNIKNKFFRKAIN